jgi:hypothetical protein
VATPVTPSTLQFLYQNGWDDLVYNNEVDLAIQGHFHVYSRTCPVHQRTCIAANKTDGRLGGPIHITTGWGGPQSFGNLASPPAPYIAATNAGGSANGFLRVTVSRSALRVEALAVSFDEPRTCFHAWQAELVDTSMMLTRRQQRTTEPCGMQKQAA